MIFIGNDIVDLTDPHNAGKNGDARFLGRVFTRAEQDWIHEAAEPDAALWATWAAKETAYKALRKIDASLAFAPRRYEVTMEAHETNRNRTGTICGRVETPRDAVTVRLFLDADHVHCIGATRPDLLEWVIWRVKCLALSGRDGSQKRRHEDGGNHPLPGPQDSDIDQYAERNLSQRSFSGVLDPSVSVRRQVCLHLASLLRITVEDIEIRRDPDRRGLGPPRPYLKGKLIPFDLSLSHDGAFTAYSLIPQTGIC